MTHKQRIFSPNLGPSNIGQKVAVRMVDATVRFSAIPAIRMPDHLSQPIKPLKPACTRLLYRPSEQRLAFHKNVYMVADSTGRQKRRWNENAT